MSNRIGYKELSEGMLKSSPNTLHKMIADSLCSQDFQWKGLSLEDSSFIVTKMHDEDFISFLEQSNLMDIVADNLSPQQDLAKKSYKTFQRNHLFIPGTSQHLEVIDGLAPLVCASVHSDAFSTISLYDIASYKKNTLALQYEGSGKTKGTFSISKDAFSQIYKDKPETTSEAFVRSVYESLKGELNALIKEREFLSSVVDTVKYRMETGENLTDLLNGHSMSGR